MNTLKISVGLLSFLVLFSSFEHDIKPLVAEEQSGQGAPTKDIAAQIQEQIDAYTASVFARDVQTFSKVLSHEFLARTAQDGLDSSAFLEKQRRAIARTFNLGDGERPTFKVAEVIPQGNAVRVTLLYRGDKLQKPFYFVREGSEFKLNFAPPGMSKPAPLGALFARHKYNVENLNGGGDNFGITCKGGGEGVSVAAGETKTIDCDDDCGRWWSGSLFQHPGVEKTKKCDWNWWGTDVKINSLVVPDGWECNDYC